ncbi:MAG: hypothetical protein HXS44_17140 [Theionarchaea archaeon]|nr:hypothetical protein [Theionarchaea archaeon]
MKEIRRIDVVSLAKVEGALGAVIGLIIGIFAALIGIAMGGFAEMAGMDVPGFGLFMGVGAIIFVPIIYGVGGFISGLIVAALYNLVAGWIGGIKIELE